MKEKLYFFAQGIPTEASSKIRHLSLGRKHCMTNVDLEAGKWGIGPQQGAEEVES